MSLYFSTGWCKPFIFQTLIFWSYRIHSLKYLRSTTLGCMGIKKSEFDSMLKLNKLKAKKRTLTVNLPESSKKLVFLVLDQNFSKFKKNQRISGSRYLYFEKIQFSSVSQARNIQWTSAQLQSSVYTLYCKSQQIR